MTYLNSVLPANEARANFYQLLEEAGDKLREFTITLRGKTKAVLMPAEEYESWKETLEIMSDKKLYIRLKSAMKSKKTYTQEEVYKKLGWDKK